MGENNFGEYRPFWPLVYVHSFEALFFFFFSKAYFIQNKTKIQVQNITYNLKREKSANLHSEHSELSEVNNFI